MKLALNIGYGPRTTDHGPRDHGRRTSAFSFQSSAFSLVEILVAVALLSFIILGLLAVFNQTQRAFMSSMGHTDVLEAGRTVTDMLTRDLEQVTRSPDTNATTFYTRINNSLSPLTQFLPGTTTGAPILRTNYLEDIYILTRQNQNWVGIGYCVRLGDPTTGALWPAQIGDGVHAGVGSLFRWSVTLPVLTPANLNGLPPPPPGQSYPPTGVAINPDWLLQYFTNACYAANSGGVGSLAISNRICDGVVHLLVRAFATNGYPLYSDGFHTNAYFLVRTNGPNFGYSFLRSASTHSTVNYPDNADLLYTLSNAVPAYLGLELGILEPRTSSRYDSIENATARLNYFQRDDISTRLHLFRQRIAVRNVDPSAYQ